MIEFNKKLIFRKFFLDNTYFFITALASLSIIVWVIQAVNFLDFVTEDGHGLGVYFKYTLLNLPKIISRLMPFIFFVSIFYTLNKYEENNELKIFWIFGTDKKEFLNKVLKYSFIILFIQLALNLFVVPYAQNKARTYIQSSSIDFFPSLINEKKFIDTVDKLTIYVEKKEKNYYEKIFLKDNKEQKKTKIIYAEKGNLTNDQKGRYLNLYNGKIININRNNVTVFDFKNTTFDLSSFTTKSIVDFKIQEKNTYQILECFINFHLLNNLTFFHENHCNEESLGMLQQELFKRFIKPFFYLSLATVICFLLLFSKENIKSKFNKFGVFLFGVIIVILSEFATSTASASFIYFQFSVIFTFLLFFILFLILFKKLSLEGKNS